MITNLLNTLMLSASVSLGATSNFNNELKPNNASTNPETAYTERVEQINWQKRKGLYWSNIEQQETTRGYYYEYRSVNVEIYSNPSTYLNITGKQVIRYSEVNYEQAQINKYAVRCANFYDYKIMSFTYGAENERHRYPYLYYTEMEVSPLNANRNMSLEYYIDQSWTYEYVYTEPENYHSGLIVSTFITTEKLDSNIDYIETIQNNQYYNTKLKTELIDTYSEDMVDGTRVSLDINLMYGAKTYIYAWFQPCYININNEQTTIRGILTQESELLYNVEKPTEQGTWQDMTNELINSQKFEGINTPIGTYEVVDIGGVAFTILGMPFTFISTAFNLTLFPGTPYQVNISTLFLSIFAVIVFVFIVKMILGAIGNK